MFPVGRSVRIGSHTLGIAKLGISSESSPNLLVRFADFLSQVAGVPECFVRSVLSWQWHRLRRAHNNKHHIPSGPGHGSHKDR
jgi:hypothetical protein